MLSVLQEWEGPADHNKGPARPQGCVLHSHTQNHDHRAVNIITGTLGPSRRCTHTPLVRLSVLKEWEGQADHNKGPARPQGCVLHSHTQNHDHRAVNIITGTLGTSRRCTRPLKKVIRSTGTGGASRPQQGSRPTIGVCTTQPHPKPRPQGREYHYRDAGN